jgi:DNA processing protein
VRRYDAESLARVFSLSDDQLLSALNVAHASRLSAFHGCEPSDTRVARGTQWATIAVCEHDPRYVGGPDGRPDDGPTTAAGAGARASSVEDEPGETPTPGWGAPPVLRLGGQLDRIEELRAGPLVAIVGTRRATDYGLEIARSIARDLAEAGLVVISGLAEGIASAAHVGALEARRGLTATVMLGGLDICTPAVRRRLYGAILASGCALSEMPQGARARRWCYAARNRMIAGLADLVVVVEAEDRPCDLMAARFADVLGRRVAAVPGRVTSPASQGTHALLASGTCLVRDASDVLDLFHATQFVLNPGGGTTPTRGVDAPSGSGRTRRAPDGVRRLEGSTEQSRQGSTSSGQEPGLSAMIAHVGAGIDTVDRLTSGGMRREDALMGLAELELRGLVVRGEGGRYVPCAGALEGLGECGGNHSDRAHPRA